ncbi:uncharacterized protein LOC120353690 isoform X1 [Nilaparvata lugens]|uniref:uncharacterized protein LOC120353690 isoform X1 n=1 Tax=Nilaparvata lugens TaxID=108931 RepID=UPI00193D7EA2|nr:uncharacterized protein LOC120353690 isoform X1 [Nilaparvata lugens]
MKGLSKLISLTVFYLIADVSGVSILNDLGVSTYDVVIHNLGQCDKRGKLDFLSTLKIGKWNRTHLVYTGTLDLGVDIDDKVKIRAIAAIKGSTERYSTIIDVKLKACDMVRTFVLDVFKSIAEHCNTTFACPIKRVRCDMKNYIIDMKVGNIPAIPYGDYRVEVTILKSLPYAIEETISCTRAFGAARPQSLLQSKSKKKHQ